MAPTVASRGGPGQARRGHAHPSSSGGKTRPGVGIGKGRPGVAGKTVTGSVRHRKMLRDSIKGVTKPAIRRLARRGGVKRISAGIYEEIRAALKTRLRTVLEICSAVVEYRNAKTVTVSDVIFALRRIGRPIYGFDPDTYDARKKERHEPLRDT
ncbi:core histone h2A/H2B/H3/H4 domain-containing protein [Purpureocillium lilacinum]|uniref:Histone H4 n=1 Tax=Purpureocillium lilacinum TaxID=33203 RepID=A0A179HZK6_PURLI|nr:core histone h2A/H2B/H3/H4 domain-containing protein [Purpureocillium lilacinum]OAQ94981.1 core histone h2A/H2B/H3/H4 domain-containing protein [Purpureocillium lilacinum]